MFILTVQQDGETSSVTLPKEVLAKLDVGAGDTIALTESEDGFRLAPHDSTFDDAMKAFQETRRTYKNALRELGQ